MGDSTKFRHEYKYLCSINQLELIKCRIHSLMPMDSHAGQHGYSIRSLYFDDYQNRCFYENENGTDPREKFRIRIYNADSSRIQLECKRKERGKTYKTSCRIERSDFDRILNRQPVSICTTQPALLRKFIYLVNTQHYKPSVIVEYDRIPYVYASGNVRVTFDMNIRSSNCFEDFFAPNIATRPVLSVGQHLIEVKYDAFIPDFIKQSFEIGELQRTTFSKYYICKKFSLGGTL